MSQPTTGRVLDAEGKPRAEAQVDLMYETDGIPHAVYDSALWMKPPPSTRAWPEGAS